MLGTCAGEGVWGASEVCPVSMVLCLPLSRRSCQSAMIGLSLVDWLVQVLAEHTPTISEYSFHYSLALLMNLALRNKGELRL